MLDASYKVDAVLMDFSFFFVATNGGDQSTSNKVDTISFDRFSAYFSKRPIETSDVRP